MEAPKGRYSVVEKDGRLVVIDNATGAPASKGISPPRPGRPGTPPAPIVAGKGAVDGVADFLLGIAAKDWDREGRAVIHWEWSGKGGTRSWDARLDTAQQRRLGRALLALSAAPVPILALIFLEGGASWLATALSLPPVIWGFASIARLQSETGGISGG
jgi:hypothetical protein